MWCLGVWVSGESWLDLVILEVFSSLNDSMIVSAKASLAQTSTDQLISTMEGCEDDLSWKKHCQTSLLTELEIEMGFLDSLFNLQPTDFYC